MAGDDPQIVGANGTGAAVDVKLPRAFGHILATQQFGRTLSDEFVARAMEAPAADTHFIPGFRDGVAHSGGGHPLVKRGLEQANERHGWHPLSKETDAGDVGRIMGRCNAVKRFHCLNHTLIESYATVYPAGHDRLEANCGQVVLVLNVTAV